MAKPIPKVSSRKNGRIGSRKQTRKIPKGVIYVQASFNNTIVTTEPFRRNYGTESPINCHK